MNPTGHIYMSNINMKMYARHPGTDYQLERGTMHKAVVTDGQSIKNTGGRSRT